MTIGADHFILSHLLFPQQLLFDIDTMMAWKDKTTIFCVLFLSLHPVFLRTKANLCHNDNYCRSSEYCYKHHEFNECRRPGCAGFLCDDDTHCAANEFCSFAERKCQVKVDPPSKPNVLVILVIAAFVILIIAIVIYRCCYLSSRRRPRRGIAVHPLNTDITVQATQQQQQIELQELQKQQQQQQ